MAIIRKITRSEANTRPDPTYTDAEIGVVHTAHGRMVQITTFGSDARQRPDKPSQKLQLDAAAASTLRDLIDEVFPELSRRSVDE